MGLRGRMGQGAGARGLVAALPVAAAEGKVVLLPVGRINLEHLNLMKRKMNERSAGLSGRACRSGLAERACRGGRQRAARGGADARG